MKTKQPAFGNTRDSMAAKSRAAILAAATKLFAERGFDAASTNAVAIEAGVPSALIFYYFDSKEALLDEIFKAPGLPEELNRIFNEVDNKPPALALKTAALQVFRWLDKNEEFVRLFFKEITSHRPVASRLRESRRRSIRRVAAYLDIAIERKEMAPAKTQVLAQVFISSLLLAAIFDRQVDVRAFARTLSETIAGVGNRRTFKS